jgi:hypothetical protein
MQALQEVQTINGNAEFWVGETGLQNSDKS